MKIKFEIEDAYEIFKKYDNKKEIKGSSIYGDRIIKWNKELNSRNLRNLNENDLSVFLAKVMTTFGDENDFKRFLPRILELSWEYKNPYEIYVFYSKLEIAKYREWVSIERNIIDQFKKEVIIKILYDYSLLARVEFIDYLAATMEFTDDLNYLVDELKLLEHDSKLLHLSELIVNQGENIFYKNRIAGFKNVRKNIGAIKKCLLNPDLVYSLECSRILKTETEDTYLLINAIHGLKNILN